MPPIPDTLDLVYSESKDAHRQLMADLEIVDKRLEQQIQVNLLVVGILFATVASTVSQGWPEWVNTLVFVSASLLVASTVWSAGVRVKGKFYSGTIFPHVLAAWTGLPCIEVKEELVDSIARSYYHNHKLLESRGRNAVRSAVIQLTAFVFLVAIIVAQAIISVMN